MSARSKFKTLSWLSFLFLLPVASFGVVATHFGNDSYFGAKVAPEINGQNMGTSALGWKYYFPDGTSMATAAPAVPTLLQNKIFVGNSANLANAVSMSGDATIVDGGTVTVGANKITNAKAAQMAASTIKGNSTVGTANATDLSVGQVQTMLGLSGTNTGDQTITLSNEASGSGTGTISTTLSNAAVIAKLLTGYTSGAGTVSSSDSILGAIQKLNGNDALKLPLAGGTMGGAIAMGTNKVTGMGDPTGAQDAATKTYVDSQLAQLNPKAAVYAASLSNVAGTYVNLVSGVCIGDTFTTTATTAFALDGTTPAVGARVLFKDQTSTFQDGVWTLTTQAVGGVSGAVLTRALDDDSSVDFNAGQIIPVQNGTQALSSWFRSTSVNATCNSDAQTWTKFQDAASAYLRAANNLSDLGSSSISRTNLLGSAPNGSLYIGNGAGFSAGTLTAGANVTITNVAGGITIAATGAGAGSTVYKGRFQCGQGSADANTLSILNFDSTTIYDYGSVGAANWNINGSTTSNVSAAAKFGSGGVSMSSNGNINSVNSNILATIGTGNFTIDFWFASNNTNWGSGNLGFFSDGTGAGSLTINWDNTTNKFNVITAVSTIFDSSVIATPANGTFHHIALVRSSGTMTLYLNGTSIGSASNSTNFSNGALLSIGFAQVLATYANGYFDEFRISNNARWTTTFTPPTSAYSIANTIEVNPSSWISAVNGGVGGLGTCTLIPTTNFASEPICNCNPITSSVNSGVTLSAAATASTVSLFTFINGAAANNDIECQCQ